MNGYAAKFVTTGNQFLRFFLVGACGTTVHYLVLWIGVEIASIPVVLASSAGFAAGSMVNYLLNYHFTFSSSKLHRVAVVQFYVLVGISFTINGLLMLILVHHFDWPWWWAQIFTTAICLLLNFSGSRWWVFRQ